MSFPHRRVNVVGGPGAGKSTLGERLAQRLGCPFVEMDALFWEDDWTEAAPDVVRERVRIATAGNSWVMAGNYSRTRDVFLPRLHCLVWLDYPFRVSFWWLFKRTLRRVSTRERLWGTNNFERWSNFYSRDSILWWAIRTHRAKRRRYSAYRTDPQFAHVDVIQLRSPRETEQWLAELMPR